MENKNNSPFKKKMSLLIIGNGVHLEIYNHFRNKEQKDFESLFSHERARSLKWLINSMPNLLNNAIFVYFISTLWKEKNFKKIEKHINNFELEKELKNVDVDKYNNWMKENKISDIFQDCKNNNNFEIERYSSGYFKCIPFIYQFTNEYMKKNNMPAEKEIYRETIESDVFEKSLIHIFCYLLYAYLKIIKHIVKPYSVDKNKKKEKIKNWLDFNNIFKVYSLNYIKTFKWYNTSHTNLKN